jgi:nitrate reductase gamma subunit
MGNLDVVLMVLGLVAVALTIVGTAMVCLDRDVDPRTR